MKKLFNLMNRFGHAIMADKNTVAVILFLLLFIFWWINYISQTEWSGWALEINFWTLGAWIFFLAVVGLINKFTGKI